MGIGQILNLGEKIIKWIFLFITIKFGVTTLVDLLKHSLENSPDKIVVENIIGPELPMTGKMFFIQGTIKSSKKFRDTYIYNSDIPMVLYNGYISRVETMDGASYYLNTVLSMPVDFPIEGWCIKVTDTKYQNKDDYIQLLIPIVMESVPENF